MKTTTDIISTYNTETGTTQREDVVTLYTFDELNDDARARVVAEYMEERESDPYFSQWFIDAYESEIWDAVRDLENAISWTGATWHYNRWYSCDFDCEFSYNDCSDPGELEPVHDNGYYASMDICNAWNSHARKLNAICYRMEHIEELMYGEYDVWGPHYVYQKEKEPAYNRLEAMRDDLVGRWYAELEAACEDVRNTIETLLRGEWEYYTSEEYAREECEDETTQGYECRTRDNSGRVYYSDCRRWYTVDGEFFEQSDVNRECVSIVKAA